MEAAYRCSAGENNQDRGEAVGNAKDAVMTVGRSLLLAGFVFLVVVVLTHVAEKLDLFPGMGWGLPDSPGHYLDLTSAVLGCALLIAGIMMGFKGRRPR